MKYYFTVLCVLFFFVSCQKPYRSISTLEGGKVTIIEIDKDIIEIIYPTVPPVDPDVAEYNKMCQKIIKETNLPNPDAVLTQNQTIYYKILRSFFDDNAMTGVKIFINNNTSSASSVFQPESLPELIANLKIEGGDNKLDIQKLLCLKDIQVLSIKNTQLTNLSPLIGFTKISELHVNENHALKEIKNEKLNVLENLHFLNLSDNAILNDISAIKRIANLTYLDLSNSKNIDFSKINIYNFSKLQTLNLKNTDLTDNMLNTFFSGSGQKPPLKVLDLSNLKLQTPFVINGLISFMNGHNMESIDFSDNNNMISYYNDVNVCLSPNSFADDWTLLWKTKVKKVILGNFQFAYCVINDEFYKNQEEIGAPTFEIINGQTPWKTNTAIDYGNNTVNSICNNNFGVPLPGKTIRTPDVYNVLVTIPMGLSLPDLTKIKISLDNYPNILNLYTLENNVLESISTITNGTGTITGCTTVFQLEVKTENKFFQIFKYDHNGR